MYTGEQLWKSYINEELIFKDIDAKKQIRTYKDLPDSIYLAFSETAQKSPDKVAVTDGDGVQYTYCQLAERVFAFSHTLHFDKGIEEGEHVGIMMYNSIDFCTVFLALNKLGCVVVPLPTKFKKDEITQLTKKAEITAVISHGDFTDYFDGCDKVICISEFKDICGCDDTPTRKNPGVLALLMFTSGTTSQSKVVTITNYNITHAVVSYCKTLGITEEDKAILPVPIYLVTGLVAIFGLMMYAGGSVYLNKFFDAERVLSDIEKYGITFFHASPTVFTMILEKKDKFPELPTLKMFACGSSNMPPDKIKQLHNWLPDSRFHTVYGLTETTSPGTIFPVDASTNEFIGSSGIPVPGLEFKIVDDEGEELPAKEEGRVLVRGSNITTGYYKLDTPAYKDGWLDTGDIGYFNEQGYIYIVDRRKDMINRGGEKICSFDVENALTDIEGITDAAVFGIPNDLYGEVPVAVIKTAEDFGFDEEQIRIRLKGRMASYKIPVKIKVVDEIPVTLNMKTDKKKLRQMFS